MGMDDYEKFLKPHQDDGVYSTNADQLPNPPKMEEDLNIEEVYNEQIAENPGESSIEGASAHVEQDYLKEKKEEADLLDMQIDEDLENARIREGRK